jgi:hypothetical protein
MTYFTELDSRRQGDLNGMFSPSLKKNRLGL